MFHVQVGERDAGAVAEVPAETHSHLRVKVSDKYFLFIVQSIDLC